MTENPIDKDKVTENPHSLPYAHHVGSPVVKPEDTGKIKGRAMAAMVQQTDKQLGQIYQQMQVLAEQAKDIQKRVEVSEKIYLAEMGFEPLVNHLYHLYEKPDGKYVLSMLSPQNWGRSFPKWEYLSAARLMADHTWELEK